VEWALNQIATGSGDTINSKFGTQATNATNEGKITCPFSSDCNIYLLDSSGNVIPKYQFGNPNSANLVKAVRSVGSQNQETQRAIEAAVAGGGGMCYTDYALLTADLANGTPCTISGFTIKGSLGRFGMCGGGSSCVGCAGPVAYWLPPGSNCPSHGNVGSYSPSYAGTAYLCCQ
jgi:hypothetical protein